MKARLKIMRGIFIRSLRTKYIFNNVIFSVWIFVKVYLMMILERTYIKDL